jgi:hypothetical protein
MDNFNQLGVNIGSLAAARCDYLSVRCVPFSEARAAVFSVSFGGIVCSL